MGNEGKDTYKFYLTDVNFGDGFFKLTGGSKIKFEANPDAPKDIEGSYTLTVNGRTTTLSDGKDKVSVTCHVDDNFDIGEGVRQCFEKLKKAREEIKVGDMVEVVDREGYNSYVDWLQKNLSFNDAVRYDYGVYPSIGMTGWVICIAPHLEFPSTLVAFQNSEGKVYLIKDKGLRKVVD